MRSQMIAALLASVIVAPAIAQDRPAGRTNLQLRPNPRRPMGIMVAGLRN